METSIFAAQWFLDCDAKNSVAGLLSLDSVTRRRGTESAEGRSCDFSAILRLAGGGRLDVGGLLSNTKCNPHRNIRILELWSEAIEISLASAIGWQKPQSKFHMILLQNFGLSRK
jgi:hypothetical protein